MKGTTSESCFTLAAFSITVALSQGIEPWSADRQSAILAVRRQERWQQECWWEKKDLNLRTFRDGFTDRLLWPDLNIFPRFIGSAEGKRTPFVGLKARCPGR